MTATDAATLTRQHRDYRERPTTWVNAAGLSQHQLLADALRDSTERIMLCGAIDRDTIDRLAYTQPPDSWRVADAGHYLGSVESATLRFAHEGGRVVELVSALAWFGQRDALTCCEAMGEVIDQLRREWSTDSITMLSTPAALGRDLILRSLPRGASIPTLSAEDREWWQHHTTQGRWQLLPPPWAARDNPGKLDQLAVYDQRFAYAGHTWELGVGPLERDQGESIDRTRRGLYRVTWRVPGTWDHVGLAPVKSADGATWRWPHQRHEQHTTWVDGSEADLLAKHGWIDAIHERALLAQGRPLDVWGRRLVAARDRIAQRMLNGEGDPAVMAAAGDALRMVLLASVGALHGRSHAVTRSVPAARASEVPSWARDVRQAEGMIVWREDQPPAWEAMAHPEWTGQIWARARRRVLTHPTGRGALHVPAEDVVAVRGDALYLARDPGWPATGKVGELRRIDHVQGPIDYPHDHRDLLAARGL